jgi:hypothetical protein
LSRAASALARSSHFPRTVSNLIPTRCDGVHLLVPLARVPADPFELGIDIELVRDREFVLDEPPVPPREDVRSSSLV